MIQLHGIDVFADCHPQFFPKQRADMLLRQGKPGRQRFRCDRLGVILINELENPFYGKGVCLVLTAETGGFRGTKQNFTKTEVDLKTVQIKTGGIKRLTAGKERQKTGASRCVGGSAFDRQFQEINDKEFQRLKRKLLQIGSKYKSYANISFIFDKNMITGYKSSPIDEGPEKFLQLFKNRIVF